MQSGQGLWANHFLVFFFIKFFLFAGLGGRVWVFLIFLIFLQLFYLKCKFGRYWRVMKRMHRVRGCIVCMGLGMEDPRRGWRRKGWSCDTPVN